MTNDPSRQGLYKTPEGVQSGADPLGSASREVHPWIGLVCSAHPTDARLDLDLWNVEVKATPQTLFCSSIHS